MCGSSVQPEDFAPLKCEMMVVIHVSFLLAADTNVVSQQKNLKVQVFCYSFPVHDGDVASSSTPSFPWQQQKDRRHQLLGMGLFEARGLALSLPGRSP